MRYDVMMKRHLVILLILCVACAPALAMADSTLRVQGSATVSVEPDMAVLSVGYATEQPDSSVAQQEATGAINAIIDALKAANIPDEDIVTSYLNAYPTFNYGDMGEQTLRGYRVEHMLSVKVKDISTVGAVLDAALAAGANDAGNVTYKSSNETDAYHTALAMAIDNATAKADAMAIAAGVWLGGLEQINEQGSASAYRYGAEADYAMAAGSIGSTLRAGNVEVSASVELVYEIR
ncbi:SIMPL domain-containing protein [Eubacteriales bacterium OttesenSCG-928-A19]|nr:SIMPL domain-containing protein [Eubacteriales bacterium OttesenSCG-928-A19]